MTKEEIESLGWIFQQEGNYFHKHALIFNFVNEEGFNTGVEYYLTVYPNNIPIHLEWRIYGSYQNSKGELSFRIDNIEDLARLMYQIGIKRWKN